MQRLAKILNRGESIVLLIIVLLSVIIGSINPTYFTLGNVIDSSKSLIVMAMFAMGCLMVIISGGVDVSFPAVATFAMYTTAKILVTLRPDATVWEAYFYAAVIGIFWGLINALLIAVAKIPTLIATLGSSSVISGLLLTFIGSGEINNLPKPLKAFSKLYIITYENETGLLSTLPVTILFPIFLAIIMTIILKYTMLGRGIFAIGGDKTSAKRAGFNIVRIQFFIYIFLGFIAGTAGMTHTIMMRNSSPISLMGSEMLVIAACVIGGARITGGHGTVFGTLLGVVLMTIINNNLILVGLPTFWQKFFVGLMILLGTMITAIRARYTSKAARR